MSSSIMTDFNVNGNITATLDIYTDGDLYFRGNTNESLRFAVDEDTNFTTIQKLIQGIWQPASLLTGPNSLWVGRNIGIAAVGHHLVTEAMDGHLHFHAHSMFDGELSLGDAQMINAYYYIEELVYQPDYSGSFTGQLLEFQFPSSNHLLSDTIYYKTGTTAATEPVRVRIYKGTNDTGVLIFDQTYPASSWPASSDIQINTDGYVEYDIGETYFLRYTSDANFSLLMDATNYIPYIAADTSFVREESLLQTMNWEDGYNFTEGQYMIRNRTIYVNQVTGVQNGTFESNSDNWSLLADREYADYKSLLARNVQSTGLISGGVIVKASSTTLNISSATGYVTDYSDPEDPIVTSITYAGITGYTPTNLDSNGTFIMGIDSTGTLIELPSGLSSQEKRDNILLGIYIAKANSILTTVDAPFNLGYDGIATAKDFISGVIGPANIEGNIVAANGANLNIDNSGGRIFIVAANFRNDPEVADEITIPSGTNISFMQVYRQEAPSNQLDNTGTPTNDIDPDRWDDGSGILADVSVNDFTVQVLYIAPDGSYWVAYGQELFNTLSNAETALLDGALTFNEYPFQAGVVRRSFIIVQEGTTDLSNAADAKFFSDAKFRGQGISTSGGIPGINVPGGSNTNIQFNDNDVFGGSNDLTWDGVELWVDGNMSVNGTFFVDSDSGNVGIGTTSPLAKLDVNGDMAITADSNNQSLRLYENVGGEYINVELDSDGDLNFYADSGDSRLEIPDNNQQSSHAYRGIGVNALYHLYGEDYDTTMQFGDDTITFFAGDLNFLQLRNYEGVGWQSFIALNYLNNDVDFKWDSTGIDDAVFFEGSSGRVGIGTNTPISKLHVNDGGVVIAGDFNNYTGLTETSFVFETSEDSVFVASHNGTERQKMEFHAKEYEFETGESGNRNYFVMDTDGKIGIGTTSPSSKLEVNGRITADNINTTEISNTAGLLKIQPDVQGDVELFGDTQVANNENSKILKVWRRAPEGNDYIRFYISASRKAFIHASNELTLQAQQPFTINSVTDSIYFKVGDNASVEKFYFRDSDNNNVAIIDSDGNSYFEGDVGIGESSPEKKLEVAVNGTLNDGIYIKGTNSPGLMIGSDLSTDNAAHFVWNDTGLSLHSWGRSFGDQLFIDGDSANVGIGTTDPEYILSILSTAPMIKLENARTIMGAGYFVGGLTFDAGELTHLPVAEIRVTATEAWTNTSSPTRMGFFTTDVGAIGNTLKMTLLANGYLGIGVGFDEIEQMLHVGGSIKTEEAVFFNDGSTLTSAEDGFLGHISTAIFKQNFSTASQDTSPRDMQFKPDGTKVYISGVQGDGIVWEYDLDDPWNISSMVYNSNNFNVNSWESNPMGLFIRNDGEKMYVSGSGGDEVNEFDLQTAWDITSADWVSLFNVASNETSPAGVEFRPDGKKMYIIGTQNDAVQEYDLSTAWDITTSVWNQAFGTDIDAPTGFRFKPDGTRMYVMDGSAEDDIHEYVLSTPWDISTAVSQELFDVSSQNLVPQDIAFSPDMTKAYMLGSTSPASVFEYDLGIRAEGKIIGDGSELTGIPLYFTCGENGPLDPGAEWSCGGNGEENQYVYLWDDVIATGMAMDCNTGAGTAIIRLETLAGGDTGCNMTSTGENAATTYSCNIGSGNWFRPYTVSDSGHDECVLTMRFVTR